MVHVIILAAGKGTRMKSDTAKVLTPVKGIPIIKRLLTEVTQICPKPTLIVGYKAQDVMDTLGPDYDYVVQEQQLGTGHAVQQAQALLEPKKDISTIVVLLGDHPLISPKTINNLVATHQQEKATITLATAVVSNYDGLNSVFYNYGRVIRNTDGSIAKIVEYKDATDEERQGKEVNPSYYCFDAEWLWSNISQLKDTNASKEFYLTDMIKLAEEQGKKIVASVIENTNECLGINTPEQLKMVEDVLESNS